MTISPETPVSAAAALTVGTGPTLDAVDLAQIIAADERIAQADKQINLLRQQVADRHTMDGTGPAMLALARIAGLTEQIAGSSEQIAIEVRLIGRYLGGA